MIIGFAGTAVGIWGLYTGIVKRKIRRALVGITVFIPLLIILELFSLL